MINDENIDRRIEKAFDSIDGIQRAIPKPYLLTRINARLGKDVKNFWDTAAIFMSRPAVMALGLCLIAAINVVVILQNKSSAGNTVAEHSINTMAEEDDYSTTFATIDNIENP